jgi:hypothetical protein
VNLEGTMTIKFDTIWNNFANDPPCVDKRGAIPAGYENQCAIKVGLALEKSGVSFASFGGGRCPVGPSKGGMVAGAQQLADWLSVKSQFPGCPSKPEISTGKAAFDKIKGRTGIIFLANYWQRSTDKGNARTGDHIDLWNGSRMTTAFSWVRVHFGVSWDGLWSDYRAASEIRFWNIA